MVLHQLRSHISSVWFAGVPLSHAGRPLVEVLLTPFYGLRAQLELQSRSQHLVRPAERQGYPESVLLNHPELPCKLFSSSKLLILDYSTVTLFKSMVGEQFSIPGISLSFAFLIEFQVLQCFLQKFVQYNAINRRILYVQPRRIRLYIKEESFWRYTFDVFVFHWVREEVRINFYYDSFALVQLIEGLGKRPDKNYKTLWFLSRTFY